jgi:hypothetical protein
VTEGETTMNKGQSEEKGSRGNRTGIGGGPRPDNTSAVKHGFSAQPFREWVKEARNRAYLAQEEADKKIGCLDLAKLSEVIQGDIREVRVIQKLLTELLTEMNERGDLTDEGLKEFEHRYLDATRVVARLRAVQAVVVGKAEGISVRIKKPDVLMNMPEEQMLEEVVGILREKGYSVTRE